ncbi:MAG: hypothetical protein JXA77_11120 [Bacteroidales bacterium]|nr:hypothetical protein [Bacteroidales bacterium]MBN2819043.1 hypothetical protein [Bacteroidales bacterium]
MFKKSLILIALFLLAISCAKNKKSEITENEKPETETFVFKVARLQDSVVSEGISSMMFSIPSLEQIYIGRNDSVVRIMALKDSLSVEQLENLIAEKGGEIIPIAQ